MFASMFGDKTPLPVEVGGRALTCQVCGGGGFWRRNVQVSVAAATMFNLDWADRTATCYVCAQCGHIHWFMKAHPTSA